MTNKLLEISIVIPVFNSSLCLSALASQLREALEPLGKRYEAMLVDDAAPDDSWSVICGIVERYPGFAGVQMMNNFGQVKATIAGIGMASGEVVITMDDDLQHDPALLPMLLDELEKDSSSDFLYAYFPEKKHAAYRNFASRILSRINSQAMGGKQSVRLSSFRLMRKGIAQIVAENKSLSPSIAASVFASTGRIRYVAIPHHERFAGKSNYTLAKQFRLAFDNICNVSMLPLRVISGAGIFVAAVSGILLCYILLRYLFGGITATGWTSTVTLITFFSGLILLSLGIIGEYMVRILRAVQHAPTALIRQKVGVIGGRQPDDVPVAGA
jgi:polyisoprenyl-phosphate glycosyltransferase